MKRCVCTLLILMLAAVQMISCGERRGDTVHEATFAESTEADRAIEALKNVSDELRGAYIASVYNLDFPSKAGLPADELRRELDDIVNKAVTLGLNALFFQVRPSSDALYKSAIFPTSAYLTGKQGSGLPDGFDPLEYLISSAHEKNIAVHAWINPFRITAGGSINKPKYELSELAESNPARVYSDKTVKYAGDLYYDPGYPEVRELIASGIDEIVSHYDVDGVMFDDYFYPYPEKDADGDYIVFDDSVSYEKYGQGKELDDWRRENVNLLVEACCKAVRSSDADCVFGIAPFGIWQNDDGHNGGSDTSGLEAYKSIYCDAKAWVDGGYIDYIAPQIYWNFSKSSAPFDTVADWWSSLLDGTGVDLYISHAAYKYGTDEWSEADAVDELSAQITYSRRLISYRGSILYGWEELTDNVGCVSDEVTCAYSSRIVYSDPMPTDSGVYMIYPSDGDTVDDDIAVIRGGSDPSLTVSYNGNKVTRRKDGTFTLTVYLHAGENRIELVTDSGVYVFTLIKPEK